MGATQMVDGTPVPAADACVVSSAIDHVRVDFYIDSLPPLSGLDCWSHSRCTGTEDHLLYESVRYSHDVVVDAWTSDVAIFGPDGWLQWEATDSKQGMHCNGGQVCYTCCDRYCCDGVPTSIIGSGIPVVLEDCQLIDGECADDQ